MLLLFHFFVFFLGDGPLGVSNESLASLASLNSIFSSASSNCQNIYSSAFQPLSNCILLGFYVFHLVHIQLRRNQMTQGEAAHRRWGSTLQISPFSTKGFQVLVVLVARNSNLCIFVPVNLPELRNAAFVSTQGPRDKSSNESRTHFSILSFTTGS